MINHDLLLASVSMVIGGIMGAAITKEIRARKPTKLTADDPLWGELNDQYNEDYRVLQPMAEHEEKCKKCGGTMSPGKAIQQTWSAGGRDFPGDQRGITMSPGGGGKLIDCLKCKKCGFSVTDTGLL
jgi:hypothetical protein